ncbi:hypothetical protein BKH42_06850 [Helicobacter sp. 13S00482-2]|uniref:glycoside hydrolase family protein n=1 Tax=Helicobacter sp. 13S00482-2 TaxID=1476200 RepID=UPI000BA529BD|nr:hypothetical protein [Helicobacter sp. 13S00482-2]PAF53240.1 hypothetical protein BKH42_06850 [Helicobacter sp. 13S00482-2]
MNKIALEFIKSHEGYRAQSYTDTRSIETIGYGRNLQAHPLSEEEQRDILLNNNKYSKKQAEAWLIAHLEILEKELSTYTWFNKLDGIRQGIILDMAYNLGIPRLLLFKKMILALNSGDYIGASKEMLNSGWAIQTKDRAVNLSIAMSNTEKLAKKFEAYA